jgi:hypothetical protein
VITVITGTPGTGKTYYMVWLLKKKALEEGDVFYRVRRDVLLITNIKLNLEDSENYVFIENFDDFVPYMDVDFWRSNLNALQGRKVIFAIDEAQALFAKHKDNDKLMYFLQYHRHVGIDLYLLTQTAKSIPAKVYELSEYLIEAVPRSINPFAWRYFRYRVLHPFDRSLVLRRFHVPHDPTVFYLYDDMVYRPDEDIEERPKNVFVSQFSLLAVFIFVFVFLLHSFFSHLHTLGQPKTQKTFSSSPSSPAVVKTQPINSSVPAVPIRYEDLIQEVEDKPMDRLELDRVEVKQPSGSPRVSVPVSGGYHLEVGRSSAGGLELQREPKVIILP